MTSWALSGQLLLVSAGIIAKSLHPGPNEPSGFILTTILGIIGAVVATYLGQALGWYQPGEGVGLIGAVVGALIVLVVWGMIARPGKPRTLKSAMLRTVPTSLGMRVRGGSPCANSVYLSPLLPFS